MAIEPERILVIRLSSIGDVVMATPIAEALKARFPKAFLGWAVDKRCAEVVEGNPFVDEVFVWDRTVRGLFRLGRELRRLRFDLVVDAQGQLRSGVLAWLTGAPVRLGFSDAKEGSRVFLNLRGPRRSPWRRPQEIYLRLLAPLGVRANLDNFPMRFPVGEEDRAWAREFLKRCGLSEGEFLALGPGTRVGIKLWSEERWGRLAREAKRRFGLRVVLLGSPAERALCERIGRRAPSAVAGVAAGEATLKQSAALIEASRLYIGVDSGLLFVAMAVGTLAVGIFGPTRFDLLEGEPSALVVTKQGLFPCAPCKKHPRCEPNEEGIRPCMAAVSVEEVLGAVERGLMVGR